MDADADPDFSASASPSPASPTISTLSAAAEMQQEQARKERKQRNSFLGLDSVLGFLAGTSDKAAASPILLNDDFEMAAQGNSSAGESEFDDNDDKEDHTEDTTAEHDRRKESRSAEDREKANNSKSQYEVILDGTSEEAQQQQSPPPAITDSFTNLSVSMNLDSSRQLLTSQDGKQEIADDDDEEQNKVELEVVRVDRKAEEKEMENADDNTDANADAKANADKESDQKSIFDIPKGMSALMSFTFWRRLAAYVGPGYLVCIGYFDPGNWATDLAAGSAFGYIPLFVILLSNIIAIILQSLAVSLGTVTGMNLAEMCRKHFNIKVSYVLYILAELAIIATDLAEVIGCAIALKLLFGLPLIGGVLITALDTLIILFFFSKGEERSSPILQALIIALVAIITACLIMELRITNPNGVDVIKGYLPSSTLVTDTNALFLSIGIIGATVMPHNLYLHSALVKPVSEVTKDTVKAVVGYGVIDTVVALTIALFINSSILIVSAAAFFNNNLVDVASIEDAYNLLDSNLGKFAAIVFAIGLLCAGQSSTITGTIAGQVVMEGFMGFKVAPWLRRMITRLAAIVPAVIVILSCGPDAVDSMLVWSQVLLSFQLPFAMFPLVYFTSNKAIMKQNTIPIWLQIVSYAMSIFITGLNVVYLVLSFTS